MARKKKAGRPRTVSSSSGGARLAPPITTRLPPNVVAQIEELARAAGKDRSELIREIIEAGVAARVKAEMDKFERLRRILEEDDTGDK